MTIQKPDLSEAMRLAYELRKWRIRREIQNYLYEQELLQRLEQEVRRAVYEGRTDFVPESEVSAAFRKVRQAAALTDALRAEIRQKIEDRMN